MSGSQGRPPGEGYAAGDGERWLPEPPKRAARGDFARDRARVVHSSALRRLGAKTQVVGPGTDDFARTRLTHSLEVAQVGRELATALGCDPDVVDTACLAHDLGHPPFGHNGERALAVAAAEIGGFEGNAQTLRLLTRLEPKLVDAATGRSGGLNLTRASLDAATKYPWASGQAPDGSAKYGVYTGPAGDEDVFAWLRDAAPGRRRCLEAQVMDASDDIAYSVHDVEDAVVSGRLDLAVVADAGQRARVGELAGRWYGEDSDAVTAALGRLAQVPYWVGSGDGGRAALAALKDMTSQLIGRFADAAERATRAAHGEGPLVRYAADLVVPAETAAEITALKGLAAVFVMEAGDRQPGYVRQREVVADLVEALRQQGPEAFEPAYAADLAAADGDVERLRVVVDQVAALTDASALAWHARLLPGSDVPAALWEAPTDPARPT